MNAALRGLAKLWTVTEIELRQRVVSRSFIVIVSVFAAVLLVLSGLVMVGWGVLSGGGGDGGLVFAATLLLTVFLGTILVPVLSGGSVNGDRAAGTLATTQLTLVTTWQLLGGKVLASWLSSLTLVAVAVPFLALGAGISGTTPVAIASSVAVLALEFGVFAALGVAWSSIVRSPVFSVVCTYLTLALLSVGSIIVVLVGAQLLATTKETVTVRPTYSSNLSVPPECEYVTEEYTYARFDLVYPVLAANPYVVVLDALPLEFDRYGEPESFVGQIASTIRMAQVPPEMPEQIDWCTSSTAIDRPAPTEVRLADTVPTWWVGAAMHVGLDALLLWWGWACTRTPARRLAAGNRVA